MIKTMISTIGRRNQVFRNKTIKNSMIIHRIVIFYDKLNNFLGASLPVSDR
jgi:hypothetical protein